MEENKIESDFLGQLGYTAFSLNKNNAITVLLKYKDTLIDQAKKDQLHDEGTEEYSRLHDLAESVIKPLADKLAEESKIRTKWDDQHIEVQYMIIGAMIDFAALTNQFIPVTPADYISNIDIVNKAIELEREWASSGEMTDQQLQVSFCKAINWAQRTSLELNKFSSSTVSTATPAKVISDQEVIKAYWVIDNTGEAATSGEEIWVKACKWMREQLTKS